MLKTLMTTTLVAGLPPTVTVFVPAALSRKPVPAMVMASPPPESPKLGATFAMVGAG